MPMRYYYKICIRDFNSVAELEEIADLLLAAGYRYGASIEDCRNTIRRVFQNGKKLSDCSIWVEPYDYESGLTLPEFWIDSWTFPWQYTDWPRNTYTCADFAEMLRKDIGGAYPDDDSIDMEEML